LKCASQTEWALACFLGLPFFGVAGLASADFVGWRPSLIGNRYCFFAVTNNPNDVILGVRANITTNALGFVQEGTSAFSVFAPVGDQSVGGGSTDSFLTVGGQFDSATATWRGNGSTVGGPEWTIAGVDAFSTPSGSGFSNPFTSRVPDNASWHLNGGSSPARSLASVVPWQWSTPVSGQYGFLVAAVRPSNMGSTFYSSAFISGSVTIRRPDGSIDSGTFYFNSIPAPPVAAVFGLFVSRSRRRRDGGAQ